MGHFRFWRRMKIAPGLTLNLSKSGASLSAGPRGAKFTVGPRGRRTTLGIPGTGLFYTTTSASGSARGRKAAKKSQQAKDRLTLGFFKRLVTDPEEAAFVDACKALVGGSEKNALKHLAASPRLADSSFLAGFLYLKQKDTRRAMPLLQAAAGKPRQLGNCFGKYGLELEMILPITDTVVARIRPSLRGVLLALVEAYQAEENWADAYETLKRLRKLEPNDPVILLSLIEFLWEANHGNDETCRYVVTLTAKHTNKTPIHTAILLYKARALCGLEMNSAARDVLTLALRRKKNRPDDLMLSLRYQRAMVYRALGQAKRARTDLERIYAQDPAFEDVADLL